MRVRQVKLLAYRAAQAARAAPSIWMMRNPIKIHEFLEVVSRAGIRSNHVVLDFGCGKGFQTQVLARECRRAVGLDVSEAQIAGAMEFLRHSCVEDRVEFARGRVEEVGFLAASFDRVFSFSVLEHIPNLGVVLAELLRLLKPGGELHASVDALSSIKDRTLIARHKRDHGVVQYFTSASLRSQLATSGFEVFQVQPILTSEFARQQFEDRIQREDFSHSPIERVRFLRRLRGEERQSDDREGIMLIARARRASV